MYLVCVCIYIYIYAYACLYMRVYVYRQSYMHVCPRDFPLQKIRAFQRSRGASEGGFQRPRVFKTAIWVSLLDGALLTLYPGICCESLLRCRKRFRTQATVVTKLCTWENTEGSLRTGHNTAWKIPSVLASAALKMYGGGHFLGVSLERVTGHWSSQ